MSARSASPLSGQPEVRVSTAAAGPSPSPLKALTVKAWEVQAARPPMWTYEPLIQAFSA